MGEAAGLSAAGAADVITASSKRPTTPARFRATPCGGSSWQHRRNVGSSLRNRTNVHLQQSEVVCGVGISNVGPGGGNGDPKQASESGHSRENVLADGGSETMR